MDKSTKKLRAFTLTEILLTVAIILILFAFTIPFGFSDLQVRRVEATADELAASLFTVQQNAYSGKNANDFGLSLQSSKYYYYEGESLAAAEDSKENLLPQEFTISEVNIEGGGSEIKFNSGSIKPVNPGTFNVSDGSHTFNISVNQEGFISVIRVN